MKRNRKVATAPQRRTGGRSAPWASLPWLERMGVERGSKRLAFPTHKVRHGLWPLPPRHRSTQVELYVLVRAVLCDAFLCACWMCMYLQAEEARCVGPVAQPANMACGGRGAASHAMAPAGRPTSSLVITHGSIVVGGCDAMVLCDTQCTEQEVSRKRKRTGGAPPYGICIRGFEHRTRIGPRL